MKPDLARAFHKLGGISLIAGLLIGGSFLKFLPLPSLRGPDVISFLAYFSIAAIGYLTAILCLDRDKLPTGFIWAFAIMFRFVLLFSEPTLSDDVYRYAWDGHLLNNGINPYLFAVNSPELDSYHIPLRNSVNHTWMASPYLPIAQFIFAGIYRLFPLSTKGYQISAVVFDLLTGWLIFDLLRLLQKDIHKVLIYLWNPLVMIEFSHGAHIDAVTISMIMATIWLIVKASKSLKASYMNGSVISLTLGTLTKPMPIFLLPVILWQWGWKRTLIFLGLVLFVLSLFAAGAGWGVVGDLDGMGVFGALRIYSRWWNYNSGLYHWLEVLISGYKTPGPVPVEIVGETPIMIAKGITAGLFGITILYVFWQAYVQKNRVQHLFSLTAVSLGAYLLLSPIVHPWYLTIIMPILPFLHHRYQWPWIYLSLAIVLSYTTYINPIDFREYGWVRLIEYIPSFTLLALAWIINPLERMSALRRQE
jgi:alpha-1,6-mannosyltransferase